MDIRMIQEKPSMLLPILSIVVAIVFAATGQLLFKLGMDQVTAMQVNDVAATSQPLLFKALLTPAVIAGLISYAIGTLGWLVALSKFQLSLAYPILALSNILVPIGARVVFHEDISIVRWVGIVVVTLGVIIIAQSR
jgi:drug/metabolite transporter (DMT)-like permease